MYFAQSIDESYSIVLAFFYQIVKLPRRKVLQIVNDVSMQQRKDGSNSRLNV